MANIQNAPLRPHYDSDEAYQIDLDAFNAEVSNQINNGELTGAEVETGTDDQGRPVIGGVV